MPIVDRFIERVPLRLGGRDWLLVITYGALLDAQEVSGVDMLGSVEAFTKPCARTTFGLLWGALHHQDPSVQFRDVGAMVRSKDIPRIHEALGRAFMASMPDPDPDAPKGKSKDKPMGWLATRSGARIELRLTDEEFLAETPRSLHALREASVDHRRWVELVVGGVRETVMNCHAGKAVVKAKDFILHRAKSDKPTPLDLGEALLYRIQELEEN